MSPSEDARAIARRIVAEVLAGTDRAAVPPLEADPDDPHAIARRIVVSVLAADVMREPAVTPDLGPRTDREAGDHASAAPTPEAADGPPPIPEAALAAAGASELTAASTSLEAADPASVPHGTDAEQAPEPEPGPDLEEPRRGSRWLVATLIGAIALTVLLPLVAAALRDLLGLP